MLALLLARRGVPMTLLEMHKDFDREFRGNTIHPPCLKSWTKLIWPIDFTSYLTVRQLA